MKKTIGVITILFLISGSAGAADYWHLGIGVRGTAVMPGDDYDNAMGIGILASFGDPDSRFTTQIEIDTWKVIYDYDRSGDGLDAIEHQYSGFGAGFFEKFRVVNFTPAFSTYLIGGIGGYFLELKHEEEIEFEGLVLRSIYLHSQLMLAGGLGFDIKFSDHIIPFVEGRYVYIQSDNDEDKPLTKGLLGVRYVF